MSGSNVCKGNYAGYYRYRIGNYRVFYSVENKLIKVFVIAIAHRREAYDPYRESERNRVSFCYLYSSLRTPLYLTH
ncbi:type II toxin-antitoxin system RelE family toxin [Sodalinema gerasimenkoae]|uniref:type II toxin-antitoxin system RelE family toxin n=1 Tax=Sodalinema gerasimenkoae TaxID=2862348 RepID=UPI00135A4A97